VTDITISGGPVVELGHTLQMTAVTSPSEAGDDVAWSVWTGADPSYGSATIDQDTRLLTATGVGNVVVIASALDGSLVTKNYTVTITPDTTAPVITFDEPITGNTYSKTIHLKATCNEECDYVNFWWREESEAYSSTSKRYHYIYNNGTNFEWDLDSLNAQKWDGTTYVLADGAYYLYAAGKDIYGNWARTSDIQIIIDNTKPIAPTLNSPGNGDIVTGASLTNSWSEIAYATKYIYESYNNSGASSLRWHQEITAPTHSKTANNVADSVFWWRVKAVDAAGNESDWSPLWKITIDNIAPVVQITSPTSSIVSGIVPVAGTVTDANPDHYYLVIENSSGSVVAGPGTVNDSNNFSGKFFDWNTASGAFPDGVYTIQLAARDAAGNRDDSVSLDIKTVTVDNTAPVISGAVDIAVGNDPGVAGATVIYSPTANDNVDGSVPVFCNPPSGTFFTMGITGVNCTATDSVGNVSNATFNVTVNDTEAPHITSLVSTSHTQGVWSSDRDIDVVWTANDDGGVSGIAGYSYTWDQNPLTDPVETIGDNATSNTSKKFTTSQTIYFHIKAVDNAGNWSTTSHIGPFWVDSVNPTLAWMSHTNGDYLKGTVQLEATASDDIGGSGINFVRFRYEPLDGSFKTIIEDSSDPYSTSWDTTSIADGEYVLRARAFDNSGRSNPVVQSDIQVIIDNTAPTGNWINPTNNSTVSGIVTLNFVAQDNLSGIEGIVYKYKAVGETDFRTDGNIVGDSWNTTGLPLGDYIVRAKVTDKAGNVAEFDITVGVAAVISSQNAIGVTGGNIVVTWTTDRPTTSRVVYDTVSHPDLGTGDNYGYAFSTAEDTNKVTSHSVTITGLGTGVIYYYRVISHGSPTAIGGEGYAITLTNAGPPETSGGTTGVLGTTTGGLLAGAFPQLAITTGGNEENTENETVETGSENTSPEPEVLGAETEASDGIGGWIKTHMGLSLGIATLIGLIIFFIIKKSKKKNE